jgi:hypothetical protein
MFRMDPKYIVAGEIVKTTRMYAMSVSPLSPEVLERISPGLFGQESKYDEKPARSKKEFESGSERRFKTDRKRKPELKLKRLRDFTNNIKIAGEVFEIISVKGRKTAILPWEKLRAILDKLPGETMYKGLKGTIVVNDQYSLLSGEKLNLILGLAPVLDIERAFSRNLPGKKHYSIDDDLASLPEHLNSLVMPVIWKKGAKELGFLTLLSDGTGNYRFRSSRGFHTSLNESLASLESLVDELDDADIEIKRAVNQCYRRLSNLLG